MNSRFGKLATSALLAVLCSNGVFADQPGRHPGYLHALSDLRAARGFVEHKTGDAYVNEKEHAAFVEIERAIGEIKQASYDDGKNLNDHPPVDAALDRPGRLQKALEALRQSRDDLQHEEDDPAARGLRARALQIIDGAIGDLKEAVAEIHSR